MTTRHVAIVGAGASGTIQALHLLRAGIGRVTLIEREHEPGRGTAYGTRRPEHLLNVPARRMVVYPDDPLHFARWYGDRGGGPEAFASRMLFGDYVCDLMSEAGGHIDIVRGEAVEVVASDDGEQVTLADGRSLAAAAVVLALGNLRPATPPGIDPQVLGRLYVDDPWYGGFTEGLADTGTVLLIGTGLTAIDAALTLDANGFQGRIIALSRRGLAPRANLKRDAVADPLKAFPGSASALLRTVRARGEEIGWREAVHEVRQVVQPLWSAAPLDQRQRFIRHLRPWWDVHRHRIAPVVAERIETMQSEGRLRFVAGKIQWSDAEGATAIVRWRPRGEAETQTLEAARVVNCSGPELDIRRSGDPLLDALLTTGRIRPDPCRLGVDVDLESRALSGEGEPSPTLYAIGPMTRGAFWESIAVSDIARQAQDVAQRIGG